MIQLVAKTQAEKSVCTDWYMNTLIIYTITIRTALTERDCRKRQRLTYIRTVIDKDKEEG